MATISSGSNVFGGYTPQLGSGPGSFGGFKSYEDYRYTQDLKSATTPGALGFGSLPRMPGEEWNDFMGRQSAFQNLYSTGPGLATGSNAMRNYLGLNQQRPTSRPSTGRVSYGGGGGGGVSVIPPFSLDVYMGKLPELDPLTLDYTQMGRRVQEANLPTIEEYKRATPGEEATLRALSEWASFGAVGKMSPEQLGNIQRSVAQTGYGTGLGVGGGRRAGGIQRSLGARDIMLTTLDLQKQAQQTAAAIPQILQQRYAAQYQISPTQVFDTAASQASSNQQLINQQRLMNWMNQPLPGQFDVTRGKFVGFQPGTYSETRPVMPTTSGGTSAYAASAYNPFG